MKICRNCISQIPSNVKRCPNCGKSPIKENSVLDKFVIFLLIFITIILGTGIYFSIFNNNIDFKFNKTDNKNNDSLEVKAEKNSFLKGEKKTVCIKNENDEEHSIVSKYTIIIKKNKVQKYTFEETAKYNDSESFSFAFSFTQEFYKAFNEMDGFEADIKSTDDNTYSAIINSDYEKINFEKLKEMFDVDQDEDLGIYKKGITIDEFKNNLNGYSCK